MQRSLNVRLISSPHIDPLRTLSTHALRSVMARSATSCIFNRVSAGILVVVENGEAGTGLQYTNRRNVGFLIDKDLMQVHHALPTNDVTAEEDEGGEFNNDVTGAGKITRQQMTTIESRSQHPRSLQSCSTIKRAL